MWLCGKHARASRRDQIYVPVLRCTATTRRAGSLLCRYGRVTRLFQEVWLERQCLLLGAQMRWFGDLWPIRDVQVQDMLGPSCTVRVSIHANTAPRHVVQPRIVKLNQARGTRHCPDTRCEHTAPVTVSDLSNVHMSRLHIPETICALQQRRVTSSHQKYTEVPRAASCATGSKCGFPGAHKRQAEQCF